MAWELKEHASPVFIELCYTGMVTRQDLESSVQATLRVIGRTGTHRLLADCSALLGGHGLVDLFATAGSLDVSHIPSGLREAVVMPESSLPAEMSRFWETTCVNRGFAVRLFRTRQEALEWLFA